MKKTRTISISNRVFKTKDLTRIANIIDDEDENSSNSKSFMVRFDDDTTVESESKKILSDEYLNAPTRPVGIKMSWRDYSNDQYITLSLKHGDSNYGNAVSISGQEPWLSHKFMALKEAIDQVQPQDIWFRRHPTILLNFIALGIGILGTFVIEILLSGFFYVFELDNIISPLPDDSDWRQIIQSAQPILYLFDWVFKWGLGFLWGAYFVRKWLFAMWPSIEFTFGLPHQQHEKKRRKRLNTVGALVILPIVIKVIYDLIKYFI